MTKLLSRFARWGRLSQRHVKLLSTLFIFFMGPPAIVAATISQRSLLSIERSEGQLVREATGIAAQEITEKRQLPGTGNASVQTLVGGQAHSYTISLQSKQFMQLIVDQRGIDVVVKAFDFSGKQIAEVDSPNGTKGPEVLTLIAEGAGDYLFEIRSLEKAAPAGNYEVRISEMRIANANDYKRVSAERFAHEAEQLRMQGTAEAVNQSVEKYKQALQLWMEIKDQLKSAQALHSLGILYGSLRDNKQAHEYVSRAIDTYRTLGDRNGLARTLLDLGTIVNTFGEKQNALKHFSEALALAQALGERDVEGQAIVSIGLVYASQGEGLKALEQYNKALPLFQATGNRQEEANTFNNLGATYTRLSEHEKAIDYFNRALALIHGTDNYYDEANTLNNISFLYNLLGNKKRALATYSKSLEIWSKIGDRQGEASTLNNLGTLYLSFNQTDKALEHYTKSLQLRRAVGDRRGEAESLTNIGRLYSQLGDYRKAGEQYNLALPIFQAVGDRRAESATLVNIADLQKQAGQHQAALDGYNRALTLATAIHDQQEEAFTLNKIGELYSSTGENRRALNYLNSALSRARAVQNPETEGLAFHNLMILWKALRMPRLAIFYGKQAVNVYQTLRANIQGINQKLQIGFVKTKEETYRRLADLLIEENRLPEAQQVLDLLKEEEYQDFIVRGDQPVTPARASLTTEEAAVEKNYRESNDRVAVIARQRGELLDKKNRSSEDDALLTKLEADLQAAGARFQIFLDQLSNEFSGAKQTDEKVYQLRESQALMEDLRELGGGSVALYTIMGREKYRVILVTPDIQKAYEYPIKASDLSRKVLEFRQQLQNPRLDPLPLAQELYRIMLAPVAEDLKSVKAETLMWSLDGVLRYLPVAALHDGQGYLVERYRSVMFTPASHARLKDQPSRQWSGLGLGVSKSQGGFGSLPAVANELRGIFQETDKSDSTQGVMPGKVILDENFTEQTMRTELRRRYPVVHIASHFLFQPGNETDSYLLLGDGKGLSLAEIKTGQNMFGGVELLTLSACNTAIGGDNADGKEVEGFGVLAQRQGAKAVVATLWPVADNSTMLLMRKFYQNRNARQGVSKAEAIQKAQLDLLRSDLVESNMTIQERGLGLGVEQSAKRRGKPGDDQGRYSHPYFWAPFILIGNWR